MSFDFILFDWDGTLARTLDIWLDAYKEVCVKRGIDLSYLGDKEIVEKSFGKWAKGLSVLGVRDYEGAYKEAVEIVEEGAKTVALYEGAKELLSTLREKNKKVALHSSSFRNILDDPLENHGLNNFFDITLAKDEYEKGKPDPEVLIKEMEFLKADKETTIVVGDSESDIGAGKAAGVATVLFYPESNKKFYKDEVLMKENPDYVISDLSELLEIVN